MSIRRCRIRRSPSTSAPPGATGFDLHLEVLLQSAAMRDAGTAPAVVSSTGFADMYWTAAQQLAHMTVNGASVRAGDLFASGTVSGSDDRFGGQLHRADVAR